MARPTAKRKKALARARRDDRRLSAMDTWLVVEFAYVRCEACGLEQSNPIRVAADIVAPGGANASGCFVCGHPVAETAPLPS